MELSIREGHDKSSLHDRTLPPLWETEAKIQMPNRVD
jgi:hypothetical protein